MVNKGDSYKTLAVFWGFIINRITHQKIMDKNYSMEQLWLAFVMKDKYKKVWNGEDWIKGRK